MTQVLLSADDRTGSLEIGGLVANERFAVPVGPRATSTHCCVVDIETRHLTAVAAQERMETILSRPAEQRAHKMDAGLRGNWAQEIDVLVRAGYKVAVICAFPDAGRRCQDGVVYIHDLPVLESVFGNDPLNPQISSKPADVLEHFGVRGDVVVWDANNNAEMRAGVERAVREGRILVGASGPLGLFANLFLKPGNARAVTLPGPILILCGSLNPLSRAQIHAVQAPVQFLGDDLDMGPVTVLATRPQSGRIAEDVAQETAEEMARAARSVWADFKSIIVVGGDTAGALIGDDTVETLGCVAPGIPVSRYKQKLIVTKGGGIGQPDTIAGLVSSSLGRSK